MPDAGLEVFRADGFKAESLVETDRVDLGSEARSGKALPSEFVQGRTHDVLAQAVTALVRENRHAADPACITIDQKACGTDRLAAIEGDEMDCFGVATISLVRFGNTLFLYEDAGADVQHRRHVARFGSANHAKYLSRIRR